MLLVGIYITTFHADILMLYVVNGSFLSHISSILDVALQVILLDGFHLNRNSGIQAFLIDWIYYTVALSHLGTIKTSRTREKKNSKLTLQVCV